MFFAAAIGFGLGWGRGWRAEAGLERCRVARGVFRASGRIVREPRRALRHLSRARRGVLVVVRLGRGWWRRRLSSSPLLLLLLLMLLLRSRCCRAAGWEGAGGGGSRRCVSRVGVSPRPLLPLPSMRASSASSADHSSNGASRRSARCSSSSSPFRSSASPRRRRRRRRRPRPSRPSRPSSPASPPPHQGSSSRRRPWRPASRAFEYSDEPEVLVLAHSRAGGCRRSHAHVNSI